MRLRQPRVVLGAAVALYAAVFTVLSLLRHRAFHTGRFDMGNMTQAVWATAHGHPLVVTSLEGRQFVRLGAHVDPFLMLLAPLWWAWPSPELLLTVQALAIPLGALPLYALARKHLRSQWAALLVAIAYLVYPPVEWLTLNEFHAVAFACPLLLAAFWYLDERRLIPFALCALLAATTKEEVALTVALMGAWYALAHGRRRAGTVVALASLAWSAVAIKLVIPHFSPAGTSSFYGRYDAVGGTPGGIVKTAVEHPLRVLREALSGRDLGYLAQLAVPLGALFALAPLVALAALPELALNLLSSTVPQTSIRFHYAAPLLPPLLVASVFGARRLVERQGIRPEPVALGLVLLCLAANYRLGPLPLWRDLPLASQVQVDYYEVTPHDRVAARALRLVPGAAVVSATNSLGAHLSERRRILSFPLLLDATWVAVDETRPSFGDSNARKPFAAALARLRRDARWRLVFDEEGLLVFRRR